MGYGDILVGCDFWNNFVYKIVQRETGCIKMGAYIFWLHHFYICNSNSINFFCNWNFRTRKYLKCPNDNSASVYVDWDIPALKKSAKRKANDFFLVNMPPKQKNPVLVLAFVLIMTLLLYFVFLKQPEPKLNPNQEIVMSKGMEIQATTSEGTIKILAEGALKRTYSWENCKRSQILYPRNEHWYGTYGVYFAGPNPSWKECNGIDGAVLEEGQLHFKSADEALDWIKSDARVDIFPKVYNDQGLLIVFYKGHRKDLQVQVWQILINGAKPSKLEGSENNKILLRYLS